MKLSYRGVSYERSQPSLEMRESDILAQHRRAQHRCQTLQAQDCQMSYRGVQYTTDQMATAFAGASGPVTRQPLRYRGVKYVRLPDGAVQLVDNGTPVSIPATAKISEQDVARVHHANLQRNLERRLAAARSHGDQTLISLLEAESRELAL